MRLVSSEINDKVLEEIRGLRKQLVELQGERDATREELALSKTVAELRDEVETLKIEKARKVEEGKIREREIEHKIGLERKRSEFEREQASREATVAVREENLDDVASEIKVPKTTLARVERGVAPVPSTQLKVASFYELRPSDIWPVEELAA